LFESGILADEMGLGKTAQLSVHFSSVAADQLSSADMGLSSRASSVSSASAPIFLVVCPPTVLRHWVRELHRWAPKLRVFVLHAISSVFSKMNLNSVRGSILSFITISKLI
jgi:SNF2 family DNA or RNA helicase